MAEIEKYRELAKHVIQDHARHQISYGDIENQAIFDLENDHYQLVHAGWHNKLRTYGCLIHINIRDNKFWIQYDGTEVGVANELVELGVPKTDIVLAYHSPFARKRGEFAVS
ncbi:MAG: XisI protein [Chloroflexota bacterium]